MTKLNYTAFAVQKINNIWRITDGSGNHIPKVFQTYQEAQQFLDRLFELEKGN